MKKTELLKLNKSIEELKIKAGLTLKTYNEIILTIKLLLENATD